MWQGDVHSLGICESESAPIQSVKEIKAVPGRGIHGDRYFNKFEQDPESYAPHKEITLIEVEAIEALSRDMEIDLEPVNSRRNIVTKGVALNHMVGREFQVGEVRLKGIRLCEPCSHLESLTEHGVLAGLIHRGGLRAQILTEGIIRVGDRIKPLRTC